MSLTEIAVAFGMAKSSVHTLLLALVRRGYAVRLADQRYGIGVKAWEIGCKATFVEIGRVAEPYMAELVRKVSEGVAAGLARRHQYGVHPDRREPQVVRVHRSVGERNPAHGVSNGLALLATLPDEEIIAHVAAEPARADARRPSSDRDELLLELQRIRAARLRRVPWPWQLDVGGGGGGRSAGRSARRAAGLSIALPLERD